jgi:O-antigen ligase
MARTARAVTPRWRPSGGAGFAALLGVSVVAGAAGLGLLVAISPTLGIGLLVVALFGLAIAVRPDVATLVVIAILYSNAAVIAVNLHGVPYIIGAAVPLLLLVPLAYGVLVQRQRIATTAALPWVLGFLFVQVLGTLFGRDPAGALDDLTTFGIEGIGLYFLVSQVVRTSTLLSRAIWTLLAVGAILGALSLIQTVTRSFGNDYWGFAQVSQAAIATGKTTLLGDVTAPRLAGPIGEKNFYAQFMLMLVPLGVVQFSASRTLRARALAAGTTVLITLGIALTYSRGAAVGFGIVLIAMAVLRYIKPRHFLAVVILGAAILVTMPVYAKRLATLDSLPDVATEGALSGADTSFLSRATENVAAMLVFIDHPLVGVGPGLFPSYYRQYAGEVAILVKNADREAHSLYFGTAAETGAFGMACFFGAIYVTLRDLERVRRRWRGLRPDLANLATGFLLALIAYLATGIFLHSAYLRYFWLIMALAGAATLIANREGAETERAGPNGGEVRPLRAATQAT